MNRETIKQPKLVDNIHFKQEVITPKVAKAVAPKGPTVIPKLSISDNFKLNVIILLVFFAFVIFFLINCKDGIFKNIEFDPLPYSIVQEY
jgi:hypothetical protein